MRVLPDVPAIDKPFDYLVPETLSDRVEVGTIVRVPLHGRRVRGWVVADDVEPVAGVALRLLARVSGHGPAPELIELARWAAWRWSGRTVHFLRTASPATTVRVLPALARPSPPGPGATVGTAGVGTIGEMATEALGLGRAVVRLAPAVDVFPLVLAASRRGTTLVVTPTQAVAASVAGRLRAGGVVVALLPRQWAQAAVGARVVVGARAAAWAPAVDLGAVIVLDEHDEAHQGEASPTWSARDVAAERARRAGAPCVWTTPCPSLEARAWGPVLVASRAAERAGWPVVDVVDRRREEPLRADLYSPRLVELLRGAEPGSTVVCVLNRKGRAGLLVCAACAELARCEACGAAVGVGDDATLVCRRCGQQRPALCLACGATRFKARRPGVRRVRDDLEHLTGVPVLEVTAGTLALESGSEPRYPILVGTEAVLHRIDRADVIAFLDLDAELLAPRYRASEQTLALVARAARLLGGKAGGGRLVLQTRLPRHEVVQAALHGDPDRVATVELQRRESLRFPPTTAMALVSGAPAAAYVEGLAGLAGVEVLGPAKGSWLVRAPHHKVLCDALAHVPRPPGRLRVAVDPLRV